MTQNKNTLHQFLENFIFEGKRTVVQSLQTDSRKSLPIFLNEFWTSKQRQAHSIHEISYRACFKPQLPKFFIERLTAPGDIVYDPFTGRGTTIIEAALLGRNVIANDINPLSSLLCKPRLRPPSIEAIEERLYSIYSSKKKSDIDLSMFFHKKTLSEILGLQEYFLQKKKKDFLDEWIQMTATNRLTGHSKGFFSVYTLPPNQALSAEKQRKINIERNQQPEYRDTKKLILKKTKQLQKDLTETDRAALQQISAKARFFSADARKTKAIPDSSVQLTVTSPPFLDVVQYADDNWLRCWFNGIDAEAIGKKITMSKKLEDWCAVMQSVFHELYRITKARGYVAFEVGEVRSGKIRLEEFVVELGIASGFFCEGIMINQQNFTKTANIWGVHNNAKGTNTNRIVIFQKP
ncbi:MAG: site-specific DNA-methyltransferase [Bacteroidetes bacterium]|nr:site-specific DNA-methyltransferase [Bacteroidota bacterium]